MYNLRLEGTQVTIFKGPEFNSQHTWQAAHNCTIVTPAPKNPVPLTSTGTYTHIHTYTHTHRHTHTGTHTHTYTRQDKTATTKQHSLSIPRNIKELSYNLDI